MIGALTELTKKVSSQRLFLYGHITNEELYYLKQDGWSIVSRERR